MFGLSNNPYLNWTEELLLKYKEKWHWEGISCYVLGRHVWDDQLLERLEKYIDWTSISWNQGIPWTEDLLDKYQDKSDWGPLSSNISINWSKKLIDKYQNLLDFGRISYNLAMPWPD
ncbi:MAG TPA: hypothetical protein EYQ06_05755 [Flavobacteriales bacterium]|nr:hypothetical protein [Flavobacteriales bacterium]